jgi:4-amino-4-deoxy-L-arabinose transferase-like glycosyltransferase
VTTSAQAEPTAAAAASISPWTIAVTIILVTGAVRVLLALCVPLFPDETYYWEWSRSPAAGYFDHPPGIAYFIAGGTAIFGDNAFGIRFLSVVGGVVAAFAGALLARRLGGDRAAMHAAAVLACLPLAASGLVLATPDAPLMAFGALGLLALERAVHAPPRSSTSLVWWAMAGVALGGAFLSKYTAVLLPFGVTLAFLAHPQLRLRLREPGPYLASAIALAIFAPVVIWNHAHDWVSFRFQLGHGLGAGRGSPVLRVLELWGGQLGLATPILFVLMGAAAVRALRGRLGDARHFMLATVAVTVLLFFTVSALRKPAEANWPAATYLAAAPLLGAAAALGWWRRAMKAGYAFGALLVLIVWVQSLVPVLPLSARSDPIARAHGWDALAARVDSVASAERVAGRRVHIAANRYQDASELAFHLPDQPYVPALNLTGRTNQYALWPGFTHAARPGDVLLFVHGEAEGMPEAVARVEEYFGSVEAGPLAELRRGERVATRRRIWILRDWQGGWLEAARP